MAKILWFLKSAFISNEFLISLKLPWECCLCTQPAVRAVYIAFKDEKPRIHQFCWLEDFLGCFAGRTVVFLMFFHKDGDAICAYHKWIFRAVCRETNLGAELRQTDRWGVFELLLFFSVSVQLLRRGGCGCSAELLRVLCQFVWSRQGVISPRIAFGFIAAI